MSFVARFQAKTAEDGDVEMAVKTDDAKPEEKDEEKKEGEGDKEKEDGEKKEAAGDKKQQRRGQKRKMNEDEPFVVVEEEPGRRPNPSLF